MPNDFAARVAISRFQRSETKYAFFPRALPWAITFRALGAQDSSFHTGSIAPGSVSARPNRELLCYFPSSASADLGDATFVHSLVSAIQLNVEPAPDASHKPREQSAHLPEIPLTRPTAAPADRQPVPGPAQDGNPPGPCWLPL